MIYQMVPKLIKCSQYFRYWSSSYENILLYVLCMLSSLITMNTKPGRVKSLNEYSSYDIYIAHPLMVKILCDMPESFTSFEKLTIRKNLVLMMNTPMGKKYQLIFWHSITYILIMPDDFHYVVSWNEIRNMRLTITHGTICFNFCKIK